MDTVFFKPLWLLIVQWKTICLMQKTIEIKFPALVKSSFKLLLLHMCTTQKRKLIASACDLTPFSYLENS